MEEYLGTIKAFGFNFTPRGWVKCEGQLMPIAQNEALFSLLGTMYGGDGRTTFALPDLRGRVGVGAGNAPGLSSYSIAERGGQEQVSLNPNQIPAHKHSYAVPTVSNATADSSDPNGGRLTQNGGGLGSSGVKVYSSNNADGALAPADTNMVGGGQPHNNIQPFLALNYCICVQGIYPPRD